MFKKWLIPFWVVATAMVVISEANAENRNANFVGFSTDFVLGDAGFVAMHAACQADFGKRARMCTTPEFFKSPTAKGTSTAAWIHPVTSNDGGDFTSELGSRNCGGWNALNFICCKQIQRTGATVRANGTIDGDSMVCDVARPVTCCSDRHRQR